MPKMGTLQTRPSPKTLQHEFKQSHNVESTHTSKMLQQRNVSSISKNKQEKESNIPSQYVQISLRRICGLMRYGIVMSLETHYQTINMAPPHTRGSQACRYHQNQGQPYLWLSFLRSQQQPTGRQFPVEMDCLSATSYQYFSISQVCQYHKLGPWSDDRPCIHTIRFK